MASCSFQMKVSNLKPCMSGINEILKSAGVATLIAGQGEKAAARCNSIATQPSHAKEAPLYLSETVQKSYVVASRVYVGNAAAYVDNLRNNTLKRGCGC